MTNQFLNFHQVLLFVTFPFEDSYLSSEEKNKSKEKTTLDVIKENPTCHEQRYCRFFFLYFEHV